MLWFKACFVTLLGYCMGCLALPRNSGLGNHVGLDKDAPRITWDAWEDDAVVEFLAFEKRFGKIYSTQAERHLRFQTFKENLKSIHQHNSRNDVTYTQGINQFTDLSDQEFKEIHLQGYKRGADGLDLESSMTVMAISDDDELPDSVDWREKSVITPVKDQGRCGSCWAFATVEQVESYYAIAHDGNQTILAPQQLVSCMPNPLHCGGYGGCKGATATLGFSYITVSGLVKESEYPYTSGKEGKDGTCLISDGAIQPEVYVERYNLLPRNDMNAVMRHLAFVGPLAVNVDASLFHKYNGGVFDECSYSENIDINHVVQLVGYGTDSELGLDYWLIRNSWSPTYGENGYIRLKREKQTLCGHDKTPLHGVGCKGGKPEVKACGMCGLLYDASYPIGVRDRPSTTIQSKDTLPQLILIN